MRRSGFGAGWLVVLVCAFAADARADKKKAGLFDIDWWKPPVRHEHNAAQTLAPKGLNLAPGGAAQGEARAIRLRVYADRDYRGVVIRWQSKVRTQIQRINTVVGPVFNVRFEIESLRDWDRSHAGVPLGDALLDELIALDAAREVDLVDRAGDAAARAWRRRRTASGSRPTSRATSCCGAWTTSRSTGRSNANSS